MGRSPYRKSWIAALFLILCISGSAAANRHRAGEETGTVAVGELKPRSFKQIILTWQSAPQNSQAVNWRTDVAVEQALAEIAPADPSPEFVTRARRYQAQTTRLETGSTRIFYHSVNFENLSPNTFYAYRVGGGEIWSDGYPVAPCSRNFGSPSLRFPQWAAGIWMKPSITLIFKGCASSF